MKLSPPLRVRYSQVEQSDIVRDYFGPLGAEETPRCPHCGELLHFDTRQVAGSQFQMKVQCSECPAVFRWEQTEPEQPWKPLYLKYFVEGYQGNDRIRCPLDDCYISYTEFNDGVVEFRCPFCNRRGRATVSCSRPGLAPLGRV
ncbi:MAG: hypothetical protein V3R94_08480 [Acidobacteriota bacterium]